MRHFIGGLGLGTFIGLVMLEANQHKVVQSLILGVMLGFAAWGLWP